MIVLIFRPFYNHLDIGCEYQSLNLPSQRRVILHQFAFKLHTQHPLYQHRASSSWGSMSSSSTHHHHNGAMTQPPPSDPKVIQDRFPEASPKSKRHLGVGDRMQWVQSHLASPPADIKEVDISCLGINAQRASQADIGRQEVDINSPNASNASRADIEARAVDISRGLRPSRHSRRRKEEVDVRAQTKGRSIDRHRREAVGISPALTKRIRSIDRHRREEVDISPALMKGIGFSRHRRREIDIKNAPMRGKMAIRSIFVHQLASLSTM